MAFARPKNGYRGPVIDAADDEETRQLKVKFRELDENRNGLLEFGELVALLREGNPDMKTREVRLLFNKLDRNGNGMVEFGEFVDFVFNPTDGDAGTKSSTLEVPERSRRRSRSASPGRGRSPSHDEWASSRGSSEEPSSARGRTRRSDEPLKWTPAEAAGVDWKAVEPTFFAYAGRNQLMEGLEFARLCRDCGLYDENFQPCDAEIVFAKSCKDKKIGKKEFKMAMKYIAEEKGCPAIAVRQRIMHQTKPVLNATKADSVRLYDDSKTESEPLGSSRREPRGTSSEPVAAYRR